MAVVSHRLLCHIAPFVLSLRLGLISQFVGLITQFHDFIAANSLTRNLLVFVLIDGFVRMRSRVVAIKIKSSRSRSTCSEMNRSIESMAFLKSKETDQYRKTTLQVMQGIEIDCIE